MNPNVPSRYDLIVPTFKALKDLGGSGTNDEIVDRIILDLNIPDDVADIPHTTKKGQSSASELEYEAYWARYFLKNYGAIENRIRGVWSITPDFVSQSASDIDPKTVAGAYRNKLKKEKASAGDTSIANKSSINNFDEFTDEELRFDSYRERLADILQEIDPYGFESLTQLLLRACGFDDVKVTKKSADGGIDGIAKLKINGIVSFNVAFQCKRYSSTIVGSPEIRDFRGSLTTDIEKALFITTSTFSKAAKDEANAQGKQQIDLINGEAFINMMIEHGVGVNVSIDANEVKAYEIDESFFEAFK